MLATERRIAKLHTRVKNVRRERAHRLTTALTREFGVIGIEDLQVRNMIRNRRLSRQIADAGWGMISRQLNYKVSWSEGSRLIAADRFYPSSKTCSKCGSVKAKLSLSERVFSCDGAECEHSMDRDLNAAINLAKLALCESRSDGKKSVVALAERDTLNAHGGHVSLFTKIQQSPSKCEDPLGSFQRGDALDLALRGAVFRPTRKRGELPLRHVK
jgi:putative transposase